MKQPHKTQSFGKHLDELRMRIFAVVLSIILGSVAGYMAHDYIVELLLEPLDDKPLYFTNPGGGFEFVIKVAITFGVLFALPVLCYNLIRFFEPVMKRPTRKFIIGLVVASVALALGGVLFAYYISLPAAIGFLMGVSSENINPLLTTKEYMNFVLIYLAGFAALFQIPLLLLIINKVTPLDPGGLMKKQKIIILVSFIVAAILTPTPDPMNQTIMAAPAIVMYQLGVGIIAIANRRSRRLQRLVAARQQAGLYVYEPPSPQQVAAATPYRDIDVQTIGLRPQTTSVATHIAQVLRSVELASISESNALREPPEPIKTRRPIVQLG